MFSDTQKKSIQTIATCLGLDPQAPQVAQRLELLGQIAHSILETNKVMNLTSDEDPEVFWVRHIEDALWAACCLKQAAGGEPASGGRVLDMGSGSGVPGLVWAALWPSARLVLVDSRAKRVDFLDSTARRLGMENVVALAGRAENLARQPQLREQFDWVTARALAPMPVLLELTAAFVKPGGWLGLIKSERVAEEIEEAQATFSALQLESSQLMVMPYRRSDGGAGTLCALAKTSSTPQAYPRREGVPKKRPIM